MKTIDILAVGELNVDLLLNRIAGFPEVGKEIFARDMTLALGSSTAIFAANAATLGARVSFVGMIGRDSFGDVVKESLQARHVDISHLIEAKGAATGLTAILNYGNDRACVTYPGAMSLMGVADLDPEVISQARHVHISSVFLQEKLHEDLADIVRLVKRCGATLSMDVQFDPAETWDFDCAAILPHVDVFMPNEQEIMAITLKDSVEEAVDAILPYAHVVVVKMGTRGSLVVSPEGRIHLPAMLNENVVDAIGAGDSYDAGFIAAYVRGKSLAECQRTGNLTGAVNTTAAGGTGAFSSLAAVQEAARKHFGQELAL